jgi:hypothetical protein
VLAVVVCTPSYLDFVSDAMVPASIRMIRLDRRTGFLPHDQAGPHDPALHLGLGAGFSWILAALAALLAALPALAGAFAGALATALAGALAAALEAGLVGCITSFSPLPSSATGSLSRSLRSASRIGTCRGSAVSRASFFDLSGCNTDIGLKAPDCWRIFEVAQDSESSSQVGLR